MVSRINSVNRHLFNGTSFLIPLMITAGFLTILTCFFGLDNYYDGAKGVIFTISKASMAFVIPLISGFIAYSISDKAGLIPGLIGGAFCYVIGAGYIGGILTGIMCGYLALWMIKYIKLPVKYDHFKFIVLAPILNTMIIGALMIYVVDPIVRHIFDAVTIWLNGLSAGNIVLFGTIMGLFTAFDIGGPFSRAAINVASNLAGFGAFVPQACIFASSIVVPIGLAFAVTISKYSYSKEERLYGKVLWFFGIFGFLDGGIPMMAADPIRVIPSAMVGSAVCTTLIPLFGSMVNWQRGGILALFYEGNFLMITGLVVSVIAGGTVIALMLKYLKR